MLSKNLLNVFSQSFYVLARELIKSKEDHIIKPYIYNKCFYSLVITKTKTDLKFYNSNKATKNNKVKNERIFNCLVYEYDKFGDLIKKPIYMNFLVLKK